MYLQRCLLEESLLSVDERLMLLLLNEARSDSQVAFAGGMFLFVGRRLVIKSRLNRFIGITT